MPVHIQPRKLGVIQWRVCWGAGLNRMEDSVTGLFSREGADAAARGHISLTDAAAVAVVYSGTGLGPDHLSSHLLWALFNRETEKGLSSKGQSSVLHPDFPWLVTSLTAMGSREQENGESWEQDSEPGIVSAEGLEVSFPSMLIQARDSVAAPRGFLWSPGLWLCLPLEVILSFLSTDWVPCLTAQVWGPVPARSLFTFFPCVCHHAHRRPTSPPTGDGPVCQALMDSLSFTLNILWPVIMTYFSLSISLTPALQYLSQGCGTHSRSQGCEGTQ